MKKILTTLAILTIGATSSIAFAAKQSQNTEFVLLPTMSYETNQQNRAWVGTFQLVWNDFEKYIVKRPVKFVTDKNNKMIKELNKKKFTEKMLSANSYYKTFGAISPKLKQDIESGIKKKFNETSDILDLLDWTPDYNKYLVYAMLKKDFKFEAPFDKLDDGRFGKFPTKVKYFGINDNSDKALREQVKILFYYDKDDYAIELKTKGQDVVYLYKTTADKNFEKLYRDMQIKKSTFVESRDFGDKDKLKVPDINLYKLEKYTELTGKEIKGKNMYISDAMQTIDFKMNNEGVKLKSEAAIATMRCSLEPVSKEQPRNFYFDDTFVLFLQEDGKKQPYFALRVYDLALINKTGKPETNSKN